MVISLNLDMILTCFHFWFSATFIIQFYETLIIFLFIPAEQFQFKVRKITLAWQSWSLIQILFPWLSTMWMSSIERSWKYWHQSQGIQKLQQVKVFIMTWIWIRLFINREACLLECKAEQLHAKCGCLPYYYPDFSKIWGVNTKCNRTMLSCLSRETGTVLQEVESYLGTVN